MVNCGNGLRCALVFGIYLILVKCQVPVERKTKRCVTPNCENGWCIEIQKCSVLMRALRNINSTRNFILKSSCGGENDNPGKPKVCCGQYENYIPQLCQGNSKLEPTTVQFTGKKDSANVRYIERMSVPCITPNCENGVCIEIQQCPVLIKALPNRAARSFILKSRCGNRNTNARRPKVCCGKYENYVPKLCKEKNRMLINECGKQNSSMNISTKIVGGFFTQEGEFPWLVKLIYRKLEWSVYGCSGFLIHPKFVVTAAHCMQDTDVTISVILGAHNLSNLRKSTLINVLKSFVHEDYNKKTHFNDIGLLELERRVSYSVGNHLPKSCGHQNIPLNSKIFGGTDTELGEFPWMVKLIQLNKTDSTRTYGCSGFLIHPKFVVTAAHCLSRHKIVSVLVGTYSLGDYNRSNEIPVIKSIRHEEYMQSEDFFNDIAVLELMKSVNYIAQIVPVCISPETIVGDYYMISGWGQTENILASKVKLKVTIPYFDHNSCKKLYETIGKNISDKQLCAGGILNKDSCTGDSGGPLMVQINSTWYAIGVVSYGNGCGREGWPGIYTKIASYYDWINEQINASIGANLDIGKN